MNNKLFVIPLLTLIYTLSGCKKKDAEEIRPQQTESIKTEAEVAEELPVKRLERADSLFTVQSAMVKAAAAYDRTLDALKNKSKYDVALYRVQYTTTYQGRNISASGIVAIPQRVTTELSVLGYHHGTVFANNDAPTNNKSDQFVIAALASAGYIIAAPDYIGFGSSAGITHPYYVAEYAASASRDLLTAVQELSRIKGTKLNGKLFLAGYSQGGNVTMAVAKSIEEKPLTGYDLKASAAGAGGYYMEDIFRKITSMKEYPSPNYIAYIIQSYRKSYNWNTPLNYYFKQPYAEKIPSLINGITESSEINQSLTTTFADLIQPEFVEGVKSGADKQFSEALKKNNLHNWKPTRPLRIYHSDGDEVVPYSDSEFTYKNMLSLGSGSVSFFQIHNKDHGSAAVPMIADVITWFSSENFQ